MEQDIENKERLNELLVDIQRFADMVGIRNLLYADITELYALAASSTFACPSQPAESAERNQLVKNENERAKQIVDRIKALMFDPKSRFYSKLCQRETSGLKSLCIYDMKNGAIYALKWANILNRISYQLAMCSISNIELSSNKKPLCLLFEKTGTELFTHRYPKHFADGGSPFSIEVLLVIQRAFSLLTTPLASMLADWSQAPVLPDYLLAGDYLRNLFAEKLNPLHFSLNSQKASTFGDFMKWKANTCLRGRGGSIFDTKRQDLLPRLWDRKRIVSELTGSGQDFELVADLLKEYDFECGTQWTAFLTATLSRIDEILAGDSILS